MRRCFRCLALHHQPSTRVFSFPEQTEAAEVDDDSLAEEEDPDEVEFESGEESTDSDEIQSVFPSSPPRHRRDFSNVFMPFTPIEHFQNLAYALVNPPHPSPQACIRRALQSGAGNPPVLIRASSYGAGLVVFGSVYEREVSILSSPLTCPINTVSLVRHEDTENRFLFRLGTVSALSIEDFPIEYWFTPTIINSIVPFTCPIQINPVCLTGVDYSAVLVSVKKLSPDPAFAMPDSDDDNNGGGGTDVQLPGGFTMMANHKPLVCAVPLTARPKSVEVKLFKGFYDVRVQGAGGERGFYRIPMNPAGSPKLIVANLATCSIGFLDRVATVGPSHTPFTDAEVICNDFRGRAFTLGCDGEDQVMQDVERFDNGLPHIPEAPPLPIAGVVQEGQPEPLQLSPPPLGMPGDLPPHAASPKIFYTRRSACIKEGENPNRMTMLEKATIRKKLKLEGKSAAPSSALLLLSAELLELAANGGPPLLRKDAVQLAVACGVSEIDLNSMPASDDV
ncbi:hypothetical protein VPH35_097870 [Triticum aestivum]